MHDRTGSPLARPAPPRSRSRRRVDRRGVDHDREAVRAEDGRARARRDSRRAGIVEADRAHSSSLPADRELLMAGEQRSRLDGQTERSQRERAMKVDLEPVRHAEGRALAEAAIEVGTGRLVGALSTPASVEQPFGRIDVGRRHEQIHIAVGAIRRVWPGRDGRQPRPSTRGSRRRHDRRAWPPRAVVGRAEAWWPSTVRAATGSVRPATGWPAFCALRNRSCELGLQPFGADSRGELLPPRVVQSREVQRRGRGHDIAGRDSHHQRAEVGGVHVTSSTAPSRAQGANHRRKVRVTNRGRTCDESRPWRPRHHRRPPAARPATRDATRDR